MLIKLVRFSTLVIMFSHFQSNITFRSSSNEFKGMQSEEYGKQITTTVY